MRILLDGSQQTGFNRARVRCSKGAFRRAGESWFRVILDQSGKNHLAVRWSHSFEVWSFWTRRRIFRRMAAVWSSARLYGAEDSARMFGWVSLKLTSSESGAGRRSRQAARQRDFESSAERLGGDPFEGLGGERLGLGEKGDDSGSDVTGFSEV